jgi:hypothetical protein
VSCDVCETHFVSAEETMTDETNRCPLCEKAARRAEELEAAVARLEAEAAERERLLGYANAWARSFRNRALALEAALEKERRKE